MVLEVEKDEEENEVKAKEDKEEVGNMEKVYGCVGKSRGRDGGEDVRCGREEVTRRMLVGGGGEGEREANTVVHGKTQSIR